MPGGAKRGRRMQLAVSYQRPGGGPPYILTPKGAPPSSGPCCAIYINADTTVDLNLLNTLPGIIAQFQNNRPLSLLAFLYFNAPITADALPALANTLTAYPWKSNLGIDRHGGIALWLDDPATVTVDVISSAAKLPMIALYDRGPPPTTTPELVAPQSHPLLALAPGNAAAGNLFISGDTVIVGANEAGDALRLSGKTSLSITLGTTQSDASQAIAALAPPVIDIPLAGANCGDLKLSGTLGAPISAIGIGFRFGLEASPAVPPLAYPLLDNPAALAGWPFTATISLLSPLVATRCWWMLMPWSGNTIRSAYRTVTGEVIGLTPSSGGAQLLFNSVQGRRYLTPSGNYAVSVLDPSFAGGTADLICGLSGVEYIALQPGDLLSFTAAQPAAANVLSNPSLAKPADVTFRLDPGDTRETTAWATVLPADGKTPPLYYSEPNQAPFFTTTEAGGLELDYFPLTRSALPATAGSASFPLVPYGAVTKAASGYGSDAAYLAAFEYQVLTPTRQAQIEAMRVAAPAATGTVQAVTPQGYVATFVNGEWQKLEIAETATPRASVSIAFTPAAGAGALPEALQDAFLTNQQFLVITAPTASLGTFTPVITLDGWPFTLDLSRNKTVGDYRNVLLFKSGNATIRQMAQHPELWTGYVNFNNTEGDEKGRFLSNWLVAYLDEAVALYADGDGVASLGAFCRLIDDPDWNGFLALKVDVGTIGLPAVIQALLAGIADQSLFYAHHLGNETNHVSPSGTSYDLASSVFALVRYQDPQLGAGGALPPFLPSPQSYDFRVLTLEAVFENAMLLSFANKSLLLFNALFGDTVNRTDRTGAIQGCNNLLLIGDYRVIDDQPSYSFATAGGSVTDFYMASNAFARIEIAKATMTVVSPADSGGSYQATFWLSGNFEFDYDRDLAFDLLSYDYLEFQGLSLDMTFKAGGVDRAFAFDTARLALTLNQNWAVDPAGGPPSGPPPGGFNLVRTDSLLAQFPLALNGLVTGTADRQPAALGYRVLNTESPKGISPAVLSASPWYALSFSMNLGGQGSLGSSGLLSADLLLAWVPGGTGPKPSVAPLLKIAGPGGVNLSLDLEGVIKFGAADIVLNRIPADAPEQFVLIFESIALTVLMLSFPPQGTTNVFLFGDTTAGSGGAVKPTLGWFGGYVEKPAGSTPGGAD